MGHVGFRDRAGEEEKFQIVRGNALERYGIETDGPQDLSGGGCCTWGEEPRACTRLTVEGCRWLEQRRGRAGRELGLQAVLILGNRLDRRASSSRTCGSTSACCQ